MSHYSRFLSIWMEFHNHLEKNSEKNSPDDLYGHPEDFSNFLAWLKRWYKVTGPEPSSVTGEVVLKTTVDGVPAPCLVSFSQGAETGFPCIKGITDRQGLGQFQIPAGTWTLRISHGLQVFPVCETLTVSPEHPLKKSYALTAFFSLEGWLTGELHQHSIYSSPAYWGTDDVTDSPREIREAIQAAGCDFSSLSDHHNILGHPLWRKETASGFIPILSKEISTSNGHVLATGVDHDVRYRIPSASQRNPETLRAEFLRVTGEIRDSGGVAQLNHPYTESSSTSWPQAFNDQLSCFDAMEIWNGAYPLFPGHYNHRGFQLWLETLKQGVRLTGTSGSDTHNRFGDQYEEIKAELFQIIRGLRSGQNPVPKEAQSRADLLLKMYETSYPPFMDWIREGLGAACLRNYVYTGGERSVEAILNAIRRGRVFVTNGPVMDLQVTQEGGAAAVNLRAAAIRPIKDLTFYFSDGRILRETLTETSPGNYQYQSRLPVLRAQWLLCTIGEAPQSFAVSNPVDFSC